MFKQFLCCLGLQSSSSIFLGLSIQMFNGWVFSMDPLDALPKASHKASSLRPPSQSEESLASIPLIDKARKAWPVLIALLEAC